MTVDWAEVAKAKAGDVLPRLKAIKVLADLKTAGCTVDVEEGMLKVRGTLTDALRAKIRENKELLLSQLGAQEAGPEAWDEVKARSLVEEVTYLLETRGWGRADDETAYKRSIEAADKVDERWLARDMQGLREAVRAFQRIYE